MVRVHVRMPVDRIDASGSKDSSKLVSIHGGINCNYCTNDK